MKYSPPPPRTRARSLPMPSDGGAGIGTAGPASMPTSGCALRDPVSPDAPRRESGSSREHHLPPVKDESVIRVFVRPLHAISAGNEPAPLANFLSELSLSLQRDASAPRDLSFNIYSAAAIFAAAACSS